MRSSIASSRTLASSYTCAFCKHLETSNSRTKVWRQSSPLTSQTSSSRILPDVQPKHNSRRYYSQTRVLSAAEQTVAHTPEDDQTQYSFAIRPQKVKKSRTSQIRQSLRAWSAQNEKSKQDEQVDSLPYEGKITRLPNALFIGTQQKDQYIEHEQQQDQEEALDSTGDNMSFGSGDLLQPGTLIVHRSLLAPRQNVIYLGDIGQQSLLLLSDGRWLAEKISQKRASVSTQREVPIPNFLTPREVEALKQHMPRQDVTRSLQDGSPFVPMSWVGSLPHDVVDPILSRMQEFQGAEQRFLRDNKAQLQQIYNSLAYEDKWRTIPGKELPLLALGLEYDAMDGPSRKALIRHANTFHPSFVAVQTAETITYYVAPKSTSGDLDLVQEWARSYQEAAAKAASGKNVADLLRHNPLSSFIDKARHLIMKSRKLRAPTSMGVLGPTLGHKFIQPTKVPTGQIFTSDERKIIAYLWDISMRRPESSATWAHASLIVRAIGAYPNMELGQRIFRMLLQELGCVDPWELRHDIDAPTYDTRVSGPLKQLREEALASIEPIIDEADCTTFADSMSDLRKDWGNMEAFCIDSAQSKNPEDAISIEPASEIEGCQWIHVHFSHPTAHFGAKHPVARLARAYGTSNYDLPPDDVARHMLPLPVIHQFRLKENAPVLTVSTLLSTDGRVHDIKVTPGILRNVIKIEREVLTKRMSPSDIIEEAILVVGRVSSVPVLAQDAGSNGDLDAQETISRAWPKLSLILELLTARRKQRYSEAESPTRVEHVQLVAMTHSLPTERKIDRQFDSYHWQGDPGIIVTALRRANIRPYNEVRAYDITAQAMRLAGESIGKWMSDRQIPAIFLSNTMSASTGADEKEPIDRSTVGVFSRSATPRPWLIHNMTQYAACSSPLRRYIDMTAHYQVDSYLKAEAQGLLSDGVPVNDESILAFSQADIEQYLAADCAASDTMDAVQRDTSMFRVCRALFRAFHFKETTLPETMEMIVITPAQRAANGKIKPAEGKLVPWAAKVRLDPSPEGYEKMAKLNSFLPIKLIRVDPAVPEVIACAVGPPTTEQQFIDTLKCYNNANLEQS